MQQLLRDNINELLWNWIMWGEKKYMFSAVKKDWETIAVKTRNGG